MRQRTLRDGRARMLRITLMLFESSSCVQTVYNIPTFIDVHIYVDRDDPI